MRQDTGFKFLKYSGRILTCGRIHCFLCGLRITEWEHTYLKAEGFLIYDHLRKTKMTPKLKLSKAFTYEST